MYITFKEFKNTAEYKSANVVEVFDQNGIEFDDDYPEEELERMCVFACEIRGGYVSLTLS